MMRLNSIVAAVVAVGVLVAAGGARAESLTDALIGAYKNSGLLEQNRATLRAADEDVAQAMATLRPVVNYMATSTLGFSLSSGNSAVNSDLSITLEQVLYDFGASQLGIEASKETVLATREGLIGVEMQVLLSAVTAFLDVRDAAAQVNLRQSNLRLIEQELRASRDRFEVGEVTRTDVAIAESRLAASQSGLASAQGNLAQARESYRVAVGRYPGTLSAPPNPPQTARTLEDARTVAVRTHPDIRRAMRQVTVAELGVKRAEAAIRPTLSIRGSVGVDQDLNNSSSIGLRFGGPVYQGGRISSQIRQAQARRDAQRANLHLVRQNVEQNVGNAWAFLTVAQASLAASTEQVRAATVAFRGVQEEATLGARTTLDVLNAEQELLDARAAQISADTNRVQAIYTLLGAMGLLTVKHLGLGVVTYDPAAYYDAVRDAPTRYVSPQGDKLDRVMKSLGKK